MFEMPSCWLREEFLVERGFGEIKDSSQTFMLSSCNLLVLNLISLECTSFPCSSKVQCVVLADKCEGTYLLFQFILACN